MRNVSGSVVSDVEMKFWGCVVIALSIGVGLMAITIEALRLPGMGAWVFGLTVLTHLVFIVVELTTDRDIPTRIPSMVVLWGSLFLWLVVDGLG